MGKNNLKSLFFAFTLAAATAACADEDQSDPRWRPWLGEWEILADGETGPSGQVDDTAVLRILPTADRRGVDVLRRTKQGDEIRETLIANAARGSFENAKCRGWRTTEWSSNGYRLFQRSQTSCPEGNELRLAGIKTLLSEDTLLDVQLIQSTQQARLGVRRFRRASGASPTGARAPSAPWTVFDVIEAVDKIGPEVVEAVLAESGSRFDLNAHALKRLAREDVPDRIIDLMVALSFPEKYVVERNRIVRVSRPAFANPAITAIPVPVSFWYYDVFFPYLYGSPLYSPFWYDHAFWIYPAYSTGGAVWDPGGNAGGQLIRGRGYATVHPQPVRQARPRTSSSHSGVPGSQSNGVSSSSAEGSSGATSVSSAGSGDSSAAGTAASSGASHSGSATPGGYSHGGSHGSSGQAQPKERER